MNCYNLYSILTYLSNDNNCRLKNMNCTMTLTHFYNIPAFTINGHTGDILSAHVDIKALFCLGRQEHVLSTICIGRSNKTQKLNLNGPTL